LRNGEAPLVDEPVDLGVQFSSSAIAAAPVRILSVGSLMALL
jgi:hypothetical protein